MSEKSTSQILQEGRALIAQGWCQGPYMEWEDGGTQYCAHGALLRACGLLTAEGTFVKWTQSLQADRSFGRATMVLAAAVERLTNGHYTTAIQYNETVGRTQAEVLALFDEALAEVTK